jgi:hypothetical protein
MFERKGSAKSLWVMAVALAVALAATVRPGAEDRPFKPLRTKLYTPWNTERELVDIEIVGSTSRNPNSHRLEPERVLRFRLEKAYVSALLAEQEPGYGRPPSVAKSSTVLCVQGMPCLFRDLGRSTCLNAKALRNRSG